MISIGRRCSLCGGRLNGHLCTECGLDNSKSDENYIVAGKLHRDSESLTHVHTEAESPFAGKTVTRDWVKKAKTIPTRSVYQSSRSYQTREEKKKPKWLKFIVIFVILTNLIPVIFEVVDSAIFTGAEPEYESWENVLPEDYDPYEYVTRELAPTGMIYEVDLTAGTYKGGVHIPEGTYEVNFVAEEDSEDCYAELSMSDMENGIYQSFYFGDSEDLYYIEDFRVYSGGVIDIEGRGTLWFYSMNAQPQEMLFLPNPNSESYTLKQEFEVGVDIAPGVYDVFCDFGSGIFDFEVEHADGYTLYCGRLIGDKESGFASTLKNIVLPEGTIVYITDMAVTLVPSEMIESEDYQSFYNNY